ncbi:MAG: AbrB/MazE/SpoVT family DNA-binding domain-containing protein [Gammaproteobacteria bacterium]|nr:MAG: AbrB/MazE/SpoVT family DNA-binding domain-containing protein [Gammaproteobacteria bacterium]
MYNLIKIGSSHGIRIPKPFINAAKLQNSNLEFEVVNNGLLVKPNRNKTREGWAENISQVLSENKNNKDDGLLNDMLDDSDLQDFKW